MDEFKSKLRQESLSFPKLIQKHIEEIEMNLDSELLYHKQLHEIYLYTFFKKLNLDCISAITVNNIDGHAISYVKINSLKLEKPISEAEYFDKLLYAPYPFIFIPNVQYSEIKNFCKGAYSFIGDDQEGIMMDLSFACKVGIDFLACKFLQREDISFLFIGIVYKAIQKLN